MASRAAFVLGAFLLLAPGAALAQTESSAHYQVVQPTLSGGDMPAASSASYGAQGSVGEAAVGPTSGTHTNSNGGFDRVAAGSSGESAGPGTAGGSGSSSGASGGGVVFGCPDPGALNYSSLAYGSDKESCVYASAAVQTDPPMPTLSSQTASAASIAARPTVSLGTPSQSVAGTYSDPALIATTSVAHSGITVQIGFAAASSAAPERVAVSVLRADGSVAASSTLAIPASDVGSYESGVLAPGSYTLRISASYPNGSQQIREQAFTIEDEKPAPMSPAGYFSIIALVCIGIASWVGKRQ